MSKITVTNLIGCSPAFEEAFDEDRRIGLRNVTNQLDGFLERG